MPQPLVGHHQEPERHGHDADRIYEQRYALGRIVEGRRRVLRWSLEKREDDAHDHGYGRDEKRKRRGNPADQRLADPGP